MRGHRLAVAEVEMKAWGWMQHGRAHRNNLQQRSVVKDLCDRLDLVKFAVWDFEPFVKGLNEQAADVLAWNLRYVPIRLLQNLQKLKGKPKTSSKVPKERERDRERERERGRRRG